MIKITVELHRFGDSNDKELLAEAKIYNDCTGTKTRGNYKYKLWRVRKTPWKTGRIEGFERQTESVWKLLYLVLKDVFENMES